MDIFQKNEFLKTEFKDNYSFNIFLKHLDTSELTKAIELIFIGDTKFLNLFFTAMRNMDLDDIAFDSYSSVTR